MGYFLRRMFFVRGRLRGFPCYTRQGFRKSPLQSIDIQPIYCRVSVVGTVFAYAIAHGRRNAFHTYSCLIISTLLLLCRRDTLQNVRDCEMFPRLTPPIKKNRLNELDGPYNILSLFSKTSRICLRGY